MRLTISVLPDSDPDPICNRLSISQREGTSSRRRSRTWHQFMILFVWKITPPSFLVVLGRLIYQEMGHYHPRPISIVFFAIPFPTKYGQIIGMF